MPDQPARAADYLRDIQVKLGQGLDDTLDFTRKAMTQKKYPASKLVTDGLELAYSNTARMLEIYRSTFNVVFRRRK